MTHVVLSVAKPICYDHHELLKLICLTSWRNLVMINIFTTITKQLEWCQFTC